MVIGINKYMLIPYSNIKKGMLIKYGGVLYDVINSEFVRMQKRKPVMRAKLKDVLSGKVKEIAFQPSDTIEEAEVEKVSAIFIYKNKQQYWFYKKGSPSDRFSFEEDWLGDKALYLKDGIEVIALMFEGKIIGIELPIKIDLKVVEAPPSIKGDTSSGGSKVVITETGAKISTPLFINQGDVIRVNTQTGEYSERIEKG